MSFVNYLLRSAEELGLDVNARDQHGNNALFYAVTNGNYVMFQTLVNAGQCFVRHIYVVLFR